MTKLSDKIAAFKLEYPTLTKGVNNEVIELTSEEYEATISEWAQNELYAEIAKAAKQAQKIQKEAILAKLGLTLDEVKLLMEPESLDPLANVEG